MSSMPRPVLRVKTTIRMLMTLHTSAAILTIPLVKSVSTAETSLTIRETVTPDSVVT